MSETNRDWLHTQGEVITHPSYRVKCDQRAYWSSENPLTHLWPSDLTFFPEPEEDYIYYTLKSKPKHITREAIEEYPHIVGETLQLVANLLDRKTPVKRLPKTCLYVSDTGHIVVLPKVNVTPAKKTCRLPALIDILTNFDYFDLNMSGVRVMHKLSGLLKESRREDAIALLKQHNIGPLIPTVDACEFAARVGDNHPFASQVQQLMNDWQDFEQLVSSEELEPPRKRNKAVAVGDQLELDDGLTITLTQRDLDNLRANHVKSHTYAVQVLDITKTVWKTDWTGLTPVWQKHSEYQVPRDQITLADWDE